MKLDLDQDPGLTEDFYGMMTRVLKYTPQFFIDSPFIKEVIELSLKSIGVKSIQGAKALYSF